MLRRCGIKGCQKPAERYIGSCMLCARHLCVDHTRSGLHDCPSRDDDPEAYDAAFDTAKKSHLASLLAKINVTALEKAASRARGGIPCNIPAFAKHLDPASRADLVSRQCGGQNCHLDVEFADGVTWLARVHLENPLTPPPNFRAHVVLTEIATLQFLENTGIPAPRVHAYELDYPENAVGTSYILMEKLKGRPLDWNGATPENKARVMEQLADLYLELEKYPIPLTGSLTRGYPGLWGTDLTVGGFAQTPCLRPPDHPLGPFRTLEEAYTTIIYRQIGMLLTQEISSLPADNFLAFKWRLEALPELLASSASPAGPFYLKHSDDKGDHILVDDDYNITGIIDWELASAGAKELAFSSPCMMWPLTDFYDGSNRLAEDEERFAALFEQRGRGDMAAIVRGGRRWQRYLSFLGGGVPADMAEFEPQFQGLRKSFLGDEEQMAVASYQEWKQGELDRTPKGSSTLEFLISRENAKG